MHALCALVAVLKRLGEPLDASVHELVARYHAVAVGDASTFEHLRPSWCDRSDVAELRKHLGEEVGTDVLSGAEELQRARIEMNC